MSNCRASGSLRALLSLDERVEEARHVLQETNERDPAFERRVKLLLKLMAQRDRMMQTGSVTPQSH